MRVIFGMTVLLAMALGGNGIFTAQKATMPNEPGAALADEAPRQEVQIDMVYVAAVPQRTADRLTVDQVRQMRRPLDAVPPGTFSDPAAHYPSGERTARLALDPMEPRDAVVDVTLSAPEGRSPAATAVQASPKIVVLRAELTDPATSLQPGDRVDVFWTRACSLHPARPAKARPVHKDLRVLAVGPADHGTAGAGPRNITVEASAGQASALARAQWRGQLSVSVSSDRAAGKSSAARPSGPTDQLFGQNAVLVPPAHLVAAAQSCSIRIRRGAEAVTLPVSCTRW